MAGVQFVYSIQFSIGAPLLTQRYKLDNSMIAIILTTSGAVSGFLVQPIVGVYSDTCASRFGRRRPFILGGAILVVFAMFLVGNSVQIGIFLGDNDKGEHPMDHKFGLSIAIAFLWVINMSVNAIQGPARALIADLVPADSQQFGNAVMTATTGLSNVIAFLIGAQVLSQPDPYRILFMIGCGFTLICTIPTLIVAKETPFVAKEVVSRSPIAAFAKIGTSFVTMPNSVVRIFIVFFFCWCSYSPFMIYLTTYYGDDVVGKDDYNHGVQLGFYGLAANAALSFAYSVAQTPILKLVGIRPTFFLAQVSGAICYGAMWWVYIENHMTIPIAIVLTTFVAISFTAFNSIPYALLADSVPNEKMGLYMGVLNSAATLSQVFTNIVAGKLIVAYKNEDVAWALLFGSALAAASSVLVWILRTAEKSDESKPLLSVN